MAWTSLVLIICVLLNAPAMAASSLAPERPYADLERGNWAVGNSGFGFGYGSVQKGFLSIKPQLEYFVLDRVSAGGTFELETDFSAYTKTTMGPSLSWYFFS